MSEIRGVGREALVYIFANIGQAAAAMAAFYIFSRLLVPDQYGYYFVVLAVAEMITAIAVGWINFTLVRKYPTADQSERPLLLGSFFATFILTSAVLSVLSLLVSLVLAPLGLDASIAWLTLLLVLTMGLLSMFQWLFRAQRRPGLFLASLLIIGFGRLLLGWAALIYLSNTGQALVIAQTLSVVLTVIWAFTQMNETVHISYKSFSWSEIKPLFSYGLPLALVNAGSSLMNTSGRLILGLLAGAGAVGIFAPALRLTRQLIEMGVRPLAMAFVPVSYHIFEKEGETAAMRALHYTTALLITISTGMGLTLYLLRVQIVGALLDTAYISAADLVGYLAPGLALSMLHPLLVKSFEFANQTRVLSWYTLWSGLLNVALNFALIPLMAELGAALAALLSYAFYCIITYFGSQRYHRWPFPWLQPLAIAIPVAALIAVNHLIPVPAGMISVVVFVLGYILLFAVIAVACLRFGTRQMREQLEFLKTLFHNR